MANILISKSCDLAIHGIGCLRPAVTTSLALIAFAANSVLCRMALGDESIDPASFTTIRLVSGALALMIVITLTSKAGHVRHPGNWISALMLFCYAVAFSFAYVSLSTGVGALILFGAVQTTMIVTGLVKGERPHYLAWCGIGVALSGLVYLVLPGLEAPPLAGAVLMAAAGISWGVYTLRGRGTLRPVAVTGDNFLRSAPLTLAVSLFMLRQLDISYQGALLAAVSGALTSGMGYVLWYAALGHLSATRAASLQLLVPIIAAAGGVALLSEHITLRLVLASVTIIGGVGATIIFKERQAQTAATLESTTTREEGGLDLRS